MSESEAFGRILAALHDAALDAEHWSRASGLIDEALRTHGNSLVFGDGDSAADVQIYLSWTFFRGRRQPKLEREYFEVYHALDERVPRLRTLPDSQLFHMPDLYRGRELKTSAAYNEVLARAHARNGINVRLDGPGGSRIVWVVHDPIDGDGWSSTRLRSIRYLLPHIRQAVRVQQALAGAGVLGASLAKLLDDTNLGMVQLDGRGRIVAANDPALKVLRTGRGLCSRGGFLNATTPEDNEELQGMLGRALPRFGAQGVGGSTMVNRGPSRRPLVLHVNPLAGRDTGLRAWPVAALVLVVNPASRIRMDPAVVSAVLGLTAMEGKVAVLLTEGMSVQEVVAATGRRESTIRTHVKRIFSKHRLSRQADLVRLVLSLCIAPGYRR